MYITHPVILLLFAGCHFGDGHSVTDEQFDVLSQQVADLLTVRSEVIKLKARVRELNAENKVLTQRMKELGNENTSLKGFVAEIAQNVTIEERVSLLELQMIDVQADVAENDDLIAFLFDEQVLQDERLFELEEETENLQIATVDLESRVTDLEESGGGGGNSSISDLEDRVETLESLSEDHEARLTAAETQVEGLQSSDDSLDARVTTLEETASGNDTIAFHAALRSYTTLSEGDTVLFEEVLLNTENVYDSTTGVFTVPRDGDGLYYLSISLMADFGQAANVDMQVNDAQVCRAIGDHQSVPTDVSHASCNVIVSLVVGDEVKVVYASGDDNTPLYETPSSLVHGFSGFRI